MHKEIDKVHWNAIVLSLKECMLYISDCDQEDIDAFFEPFKKYLYGSIEPRTEVKESLEIEKEKGR